MFKNTNSKRMTGILLALVLVTSLFIGGSIARYVTSTSSEDEARVAKWGFSETAEPVTMDLFKNEYKLEDDTVVAKSSDDADIIAPGLNGVSKFKFITSSVSPEVMYEVKISLDDSEVADEIKNHPGIQWKVDNGNWVTWDEMVSSLVSLSGDPSGMKVYAPGELHDNFKSNVEHTIAWQWVMDSGYDVEDTRLGNLAANDTPITAKIVVTVLAQQTDIDSTGMLEGNGSVFNINDPQVLTFRANADYNTFSSVEVDGTTVTSGNYEKSEGSIKIKLSKDYLATLSLGDHKIAIKTNDGKSIESKFTVTDNTTIVHNGIIPEGGTYYVKVHSDSVNQYLFPENVYTAGDNFPTPQDGDIYVYGDYEYKFNRHCISGTDWDISSLDGWGVATIDKTKATYGNILTTINNKNVLSLNTTFFNCTNLTTSPIIPKYTKTMQNTFWNCSSLTTTTTIPQNVENISGIFSNCSNLNGTVEFNTNLVTYNYQHHNALKGTNITWISGSISNELKQTIAEDSGITLIKPTKVITDSWETISQRVKSGKASEYYSVGDKATVDVGGTEYEVAIAGINHDGENTITFTFIEQIATATMNDTNTNSGSWKESKMRNITMPEILNQMENKNYIIEVEKATIKGCDDGNIDNTSLNLITTNDKLFLLSHTEVFGNNSGYNFNAGTQYEYFKTQKNRIMGPIDTTYNEGVFYWLRTPDYSEHSFTLGTFQGFNVDDFANEERAVIPAFVIG